METYVLFRGSKRLSLRDDDMTTAKISRIFQVNHDSMFLSDDRNTAIFPDESGTYSVHLLSDKGHYEVNGDPMDSMCQPHQQPPPASSTAPSTSQSHRFSFASGSRGASVGGPPSWTTTPAVFRRAQTKTFARNVQLVEAQGSTLVPLQTVYLRLSEQEANVGSISEKVQEQLDSQQPIIIVDSKGHEIQDGPGTQGLDFWKTPTRKILCMTASSHRDFLSGTCRRTKHRRRDTYKDLDTMEELNESMDALLDKAKSIEESMNVIKGATSTDVLVKYTRREERAIRDAFSCCICKGPIKKPMFGGCCKTLLACQSCLTQWYTTSSHCPKCRSETGERDSMLATGLDEALKAIANMSDY